MVSASDVIQETVGFLSYLEWVYYMNALEIVDNSLSLCKKRSERLMLDLVMIPPRLVYKANAFVICTGQE